MFDRVLIYNRGEVAVRIVRTCRELGVRSVVAYSAADRDSLGVRLADEAVCVGPAVASRSYCSIPPALYACAKTGADAIHPGYGFLSEDATFAASCREVGIAFIGPEAEHIALMGDKIAARAAMQRAGVRVLPGSPGPLANFAAAADAVAEIDFPVILKAAAGGGGRGIAVVHRAEDLADAWDTVRGISRTLFKDDRVYVERYLPNARHVEVQILADTHGNVIHLGERDCSVQRRHQKLVEESPSPDLDDSVRKELWSAAVTGARSIGFVNAGTMEFLVDAEGAEYYFVEMNTRLQVEHPVTEVRSGIDLVEWMIRIAAGERLPIAQEEVCLNGHAVEMRINAEDEARDWTGSAGRIHGLRLPGGPGIRVDTHAFDGYVMPPYYDSLLGKVIAFGPSRTVALRRLQRALDEFGCEGLITNASFHHRLMRHPAFQSGSYRLGIADSVTNARHAPTPNPCPSTSADCGSV